MFEHRPICSHIMVGTSHFILLWVHRPGSKTVTAAFFDELTAVLELLNSYRCPFVICRYCNKHDDPYSVWLVELLQSFDCLQHVTEPTRMAGHTLDLVITRSDTKILNLHVGSMVSDHAIVSFEIDVKKPLLEQLWTTSRLWKSYHRVHLKLIYACPNYAQTSRHYEGSRSTNFLSFTTQWCWLCSTCTARQWKHPGNLDRWRHGLMLTVVQAVAVQDSSKGATVDSAQTLTD